jgi:hypothetical protein
MSRFAKAAGAGEMLNIGHEYDLVFEPHRHVVWLYRETYRVLQRSVDQHQVFAVAALLAPLCQAMQVVEGNVPEPERNLLRTGEAQALPLLQDLHVLARLQ